MDDRLKELMQDLGNAINESLSYSDRIAEAIGEIKRAGYDVFLVLEATIGFGKREEGEEDEDGGYGDTPPPPPPFPQNRRHSPGEPGWTHQDEQFLRALRISRDIKPERYPPKKE